MPLIFNPMDGTVRVVPARPKRFDCFSGEFYMGWLPPAVNAPPTVQLPQQVALRGWHKASNVFVPSGNNIANFLDNSSSGNPLNQSGAPSAQRQLNQINGKPTGQFASTTSYNYANVTTPYYDETQPFSHLFVGKAPTAITTGNYFILKTIAASANPLGIFLYNEAGQVRLWLFSGLSNPNRIWVDISAEYLSNFTVSITYNGGGVLTASNWDIRVNGVSKTVTTEAPIGSGGISNTNSIGGASVDPAFDLAESALWNVELSSGELDTLNDYLKQEYNIGV